MSEEKSGEKKQPFLTTLPGIISGITALIVAITGLLQVLPDREEQSVEPTFTPSPIVITDTPEVEPTTEVEPTVTETAVVITPTEQSTEESAEEPEATPTLVHLITPEEPDKNPAWFVDASSLVYANLGYATADDFYGYPLERPFAAESMAYVGHTDISRVEISTVKTFVYVSIGVEMVPPEDEMVYYGVEIDTDLDGRGDWLIYTRYPENSEWTVEGVNVYFDGDNSVGGTKAIESNPGIPGNGYEVPLFISGYQTTDPDMAWVRQSPGRTNYIEIAFKLSMVENVRKFLWSAWADAGPMNPEWFDYNDHFTLEQAGSPIQNAKDYPLKDLAKVDNTCRFPYGFNPRGDEPGVCN
jgi:hypothetical protein